MSHRFVALLRGINVGRAKRVSMLELRAAVEDLGFADVRTLLNSGNVVFTGERGSTDGIAGAVEEAVAQRTGVRARVTVLTAKELDAIVESNPLERHSTDPSRLLVAFLRRPALAQSALAALAERSWEPELLAVTPRAAYLWCPQGISGGELAAEVGKMLGQDVTMRNWATVAKLHAMLESGQRGDAGRR